jgi:preprotein translocase subunit SecE
MVKGPKRNMLNYFKSFKEEDTKVVLEAIGN